MQPPSNTHQDVHETSWFVVLRKHNNLLFDLLVRHENAALADVEFDLSEDSTHTFQLLINCTVISHT